VLSHQLVGYSKVAWRKRTQLEYSIVVALLAVVLLLAAFYQP